MFFPLEVVPKTFNHNTVKVSWKKNFLSIKEKILDKECIVLSDYKKQKIIEALREFSFIFFNLFFREAHSPVVTGLLAILT